MSALMIVCSFLFIPAKALSANPTNSDSLPSETSRLMNGEVIVVTSDLDNGITGVKGQIYVDAPAKHVWAAITDYDNQKNFVPKLIDSGLISDNGSEQVMFEKGKTGIFLFQKTVYIKLKIRGDYLKRLYFQQIDGDFKVYQGEWILDDCQGGQGTILTFRAEIKPDFFAPQYFVKNVQKKDLPMVLSAMKKRAETSAVSVSR